MVFKTTGLDEISSERNIYIYMKRDREERGGREEEGIREECQRVNLEENSHSEVGKKRKN